MSDQLIICISIQDSHSSYITDGSIEQKCDVCHTPVWLSVSGQATKENRPSKLVCTRCIVEMLKDVPKEKIQMGLAPGAIEEIISHLKKGL
jgi:hypothetical protein